MDRLTLGNISIKSLFEDCTYLGYSEQTKRDVTSHCLSQGYIPFIDFDKDLGWVWHSMQCPDTTMSKKQISSKFESSSAITHGEAAVERMLEGHLKSQGIEVRCQVRCKAGIADVVAPDAIYEVEHTLTRQKIFEAIGQVLIYRESINPSARAVIAGYYSHDLDGLLPYINSLGIEVITWRNS